MDLPILGDMSGNAGRSEANRIEDRDRRVQQIARKLREEVLVGKFAFPMLSEVALEILQASQDRSLSSRDLQEVIAKDQSIAVRVVHCANSALYASNYKITSLRAASMRLGQEILRELMTRAVAEAVLFQDGPVKILAREQEHAVLTATLARSASQLIDAPPETAYLCGLLHDIGRPVLWGRLFSAEYRREIKQLGAEAATDIIDLLHTLVGERVLRAWSMPALVSEVARFHHCYRGGDNGLSHKSMVCVVAAADRLAHRMQEGQTGWEAAFLRDPAILELNLRPEDLQEWLRFAEGMPDFKAAA